MKNKIKKINKFFIYDILGMAIYALILYSGFTWLAGFSLLYAYLWNFAFIIVAIAFDRHTDKLLQSDETIMMFKKKYDNEQVYRIITGGFLSFKTLLYLFYLFILIISQILYFSPDLISENLVNFIQANNYSILFLLALDTLLGQFSKDRERMLKISEKLKALSTENPDS